eukprot:jgi/Ulvmu1/7079/UM033_0140.1
MRAAVRNTRRAVRLDCRNHRPLSATINGFQKATYRRLHRLRQCRATSDGDDSSSAEDGDPLPPLPVYDEGAIEEDNDTFVHQASDLEMQRRAQFVNEYFQSSYDPMYHGKWVDIQGAEMKMPDYDFSEYDWMSRVPSDIGWPMFWEHFEQLTETDDEYTEEYETFTASGRLALHSEHKRARAFEAQTLLAGAPDFIAAGMEGSVKDEVPPPTIIDRDRRDAEDPWELRARREKQEYRKERDYHWQVTQAMEHWDMLNHPPDDQTDVRLMEKVRDERYDWTEDQIWDVITNNGKSVDPFVMLHAPTFKTLNPLCMPDWASQGIEYVDDMEDWVSQQGLWMSQADYARASAHGSDDDSDEGSVDEMNEDEDPLYEVDDIEGGDTGMSDEGDVVVTQERAHMDSGTDGMGFV